MPFHEFYTEWLNLVNAAGFSAEDIFPTLRPKISVELEDRLISINPESINTLDRFVSRCTQLDSAMRAINSRKEQLSNRGNNSNRRGLGRGTT